MSQQDQGGFEQNPEKRRGRRELEEWLVRETLDVAFLQEVGQQPLRKQLTSQWQVFQWGRAAVVVHDRTTAIARPELNPMKGYDGWDACIVDVHLGAGREYVRCLSLP